MKIKWTAFDNRQSLTVDAKRVGKPKKSTFQGLSFLRLRAKLSKGAITFDNGIVEVIRKTGTETFDLGRGFCQA